MAPSAKLSFRRIFATPLDLVWKVFRIRKNFISHSKASIATTGRDSAAGWNGMRIVARVEGMAQDHGLFWRSVLTAGSRKVIWRDQHTFDSRGSFAVVISRTALLDSQRRDVPGCCFRAKVDLSITRWVRRVLITHRPSRQMAGCIWRRRKESCGAGGRWRSGECAGSWSGFEPEHRRDAGDRGKAVYIRTLHHLFAFGSR